MKKIISGKSLKHYFCSIKSHGNYPDWEEECDAENIDEAAHKFADMTAHISYSEEGNDYDTYWSPTDLMPFITEEELSQDQKADLLAMYQNEKD